ncbi:hypothetical protein FNT36_23880 [Hymenobacter setariae]|jgi:hypothetical protein|uniref:Uncharacterized protein n=1 Tax=Hymenobacter setariae TaxID=2594794 RepID=A0A558BKA5_9BACT|nr:hypothetical protein [Hymenobacter setariae]TVT36913.1 hypothetical protein FNT36_23880 [Hymenobacter setariae]
MAKTFKNLPAPVSVASAKPASERDFFDLSDDPQPATIPVVIPTVAPDFNNTDNPYLPGNISNAGSTNSREAKLKTGRAEKKGNTNNTDNPGVIGNGSKNSNTTSSEDLDNTGAATLTGDARQTFVLSRHHLERLRDYVHARRAGGDYTYSQKQALQEALDLLFAGTDPVETRPDQVKEREQERRQRIQQGRLPRA